MITYQNVKYRMANIHIMHRQLAKLLGGGTFNMLNSPLMQKLFGLEGYDQCSGPLYIVLLTFK